MVFPRSTAAQGFTNPFALPAGQVKQGSLVRFQVNVIIICMTLQGGRKKLRRKNDGIGSGKVPLRGESADTGSGVGSGKAPLVGGGKSYTFGQRCWSISQGSGY